MSEQFENFLKRKFHEWSGRQLTRTGRIPSQAEFAKYLDIKTTTLSTWMTGQKEPADIRTIDALAAKPAIGVEIYEVLGVSMRVPNDPKRKLINLVWDCLPDHVQDEWYEVARNIQENGTEERTGKVRNS